ncbi:guanylate cyclase 2G-like [Strongylocentrotus purpuratus]|uniref:Guanylate cyclase domain-containing protein n=1 Tax=Strongylocentrotus purpuratus TaxID=7668 RepID=A0A7M7NLU6_STRPU|nr:guanylate cyclase 2G-like [Strongylocentrotus purpuratus]
MSKEILENSVESTQPNFEKATLWFDSMTVYIDILEKVQKDMADEILDRLEKELEDDTENIAVSIFLVLVVIIICPLTLRAIWSLTTVLQNYALTLAAQTKELNKEKKRSTYLLNAMLPPSVALRLMNTEGVNGELYESASVMFADIAGFSRLCGLSAPMEVVEMLNGLYLLFDSRIELYDVYKVETVNETYMLASGVPERYDRHVCEIATATLDLRHHVNILEVPHKPHMKIRVRFGIHMGSLVAGVVGLKMPRYCLFGDTVNTASRMQTTGLPGQIHVSHKTYMGLLEWGGYSFVKRGKIDIRGKGTMYTYWLTGRDDFDILGLDVSARDHMGIQEHRYAHMYDQMYKGRVQFAGKNLSESPTNL